MKFLCRMGVVVGALLVSSALWAGGDVRSIEFYGNPQGEVGVVEDLSRPLVAGDKVQFKIRLANREWERTYDGDDSDYVNPWMIKPLYGYAISNAYPQVGVRVSGGLRYADIVDVVRPEGEVGKYHTDLICRYTVKAGDFALPLKLANASGTAAALGADPSAPYEVPEQSSYYLTAQNIWGFFPKNPIDNASTNRLEFYFGPQDLAYPDAAQFTDSEVRDYDLSKANIRIMAVDLDKTYADEDNGIWRNIAAGTTTATPALPRLSIPGGASSRRTYYVWTQDPTVADVDKGTSTKFADGVTRTVGTVEVESGAETASFAIRAKAGQMGKTTEVYMADTPTNIYNVAGTLLTNFTVRAIQVVEPPPPSITVTLDPVDGEVSTSTNNYLSVATLDVELSETWTQDVTVLVTPSMRSGSGTDPFTYIGMSTIADGKEAYDGQVVALTVKAGNLKASDGATVLYVYANRANDDTEKGIRFTPTIDPSSANYTAAKAFFTGESTAATLQINHSSPVITSPVNGETFLGKAANKTQDYKITVADAKANLDGKYVVYIDKNQSGAYEAISNCTVNASGVLTFQAKYLTGGKTYKTRIYVENQDGYASDVVSYDVQVNVEKRVEMTALDENGTVKKTFNEGDTVEISFTFSEPFEADGTAYVFLKPADDDSRNLVDCDAFDDDDFAAGIPILVGETNASATAVMTFLDGVGTKGSILTYNVIVRSSDDTTDDSNIIDVWGSKQLSLSVKNVAPVVESIAVNGAATFTSGSTNSVLAAVDVSYQFQISAWDQSADIDLVADTFTTVVQFYENDQPMKEEILHGDPSESANTITYAFETEGMHKITAYSYDKDMSKTEINTAKKNAFTIYVRTTSTPSVMIQSANGTSAYHESDTGAQKSLINVNLNLAPSGLGAGKALTVKLEVLRDPDYAYDPAVDDYPLPVLSKDTLSFRSGVTNNTIYFTSLDGTDLTLSEGFILKASVTDTTMSSDGVQTWADYYQSYEWRFTVSNDEPVIGPGLASTNETASAINVPVTIPWRVDDVTIDQKTMEVTWTGTGNDIGAETVDVSKGTMKKVVTFTSSGHKTVTLTVLDKDGGTATRNYYYYVAPSKVVELYPRQPAGGSISALSKNYTGAGGLGKGRVWASDADKPTEIADFVQKWSYDPEVDGLSIYARGYKVGDVDNGALTPGRDFALTPNGSSAAAAPYYGYVNSLDKDSFFYCWIINSRDGEDNSAGYTGAHLNGLVDPEIGLNAAVSGQKISLPEYEEDAVSYQATVLEAIFALEYLPEDNVGDINQDGVPDIYAAATAWSGSSSSGDDSGANLLCSIAAGTGLDDASPSDVKSVASYNGDTVSTTSGVSAGDFLPPATSSGSTLIPNVSTWAPVDKPFTAKLELRGFHDGLNYREKSNGLNRNVYGTWISEPSFSKAEWFAIAYHNADAGVTPEDLKDAANWDANIATLTAYIKDNAKSWIPENRTDPTVDDTDEDGFPDGYEYYFWYYAAVGEVDAEGNWTRLTGSKFSLKDMATGEVLTADEIMAAFNPTVATTGDATTRDTDNDGLTDLEELAMGTNPINWDTDGDGLSDYWEIMNGMHPILAGKNDAGISQGADMNEDGDFMARYDSDATYAIVEFADGSLYAIPDDGATMLTDADALNESALTSFQAIKVFRYGKATENEFVPTSRGGAKAKPLDVVEWNLGEATNDTLTVLHKQKVSLLHDQVYAQFGFDPRTAWHKNDAGYVSARWSPSVTYVTTVSAESGEAVSASGITKSAIYEGDSGKAVNTVKFTARDEYLLLKYRYETGIEGFSRSADEALWASRQCAEVFTKGTTAPNLPFTEFSWLDDALSTDTAVDKSTFTSATHGADTDGDGVPDGWELYVKHNPNDATDASLEDDGDGLPLVEEYAGTDSCTVYGETVMTKACTTISQNHPGAAKGWYNKFFPTDPWDKDTDGDGISDFDEGAVWQAKFFFGNKAETDEIKLGSDEHTFTFIYGTPVDDGSTCIRGGGLNPCTVDTDGDGLPDPWERQFAGVVFTATAEPADTNLVLTSSQLTLIRRGDGLGSGSVTVPGAYITAGMDGTFGYNPDVSGFTGDAYTNPKFADPRTGTVRDYDFDHDGLQNYQEYLVQALRHLRYDDASTPLMGQWMPSGAPDSLQFFGFLPMNALDGDTFFEAVKTAGYPATEAWNFRELGYFAVPPKAWDKVALNTKTKGALTYDAMGYRVMLPPKAVAGKAQAAGYCSTDPRNWDTDGDGMDDYYELFHGLNPLLGDVTANDTANDVICQVYGEAGVSVCFWYNAWMGWPMSAPENLSYDAMKYPWLIGTPGCDADGDGLNNYEETLYANITSPQPSHTDPTPLWMTDSTSANKASFTAQYYKIDADRDFAKYPWTAADEDGFVFAFEENEGYDTDHDGLSDSEEKQLTSTERSDPLDFTDPDRRQALWFPGENSAAVSYICAPKAVAETDFDIYRQFTVEAWVFPEDFARDQVILERTVNYAANTLSNNVSQLRANFRIGIRADGHVYGMFDTSDAVTTGSDKSSEMVLGSELTNAWTHLALTFDGKRLVLYVNGAQADTAETSLVPANGILGITQRPEIKADHYPVISYTALPERALVLGAQAQTAAALSLTEKTDWTSFGAFYKGYIDEVSVWDGARTAEEIKDDYKNRTRLTRDDVIAQRAEVYQAYSEGATRNDNDTEEMLPAELMQHYNFQTLPGAVEAKDVMWEPSGFTKYVLDNVRVGEKAVPGDLYCGWWFALPVHSTVYANYRWVPWIPNTVSHIPALDGSTGDSRYWAEYVAGVCAASEVKATGNMTSYIFPNTMNPYSHYHDVGGSDATYYYNRLAALANIETNLFGEVCAKNKFQKRRSSIGTTDLIPLGGAFAKRCETMWDDLGAADAWTYTGDDLDANGIPDWWEAYAVANYGAAADDFSWTTLVTRNGAQMTAREAYIRDLASGMLPDGTVNAAFNRTSADVDGDGVSDWWQTYYGISSDEGLDDKDNDGLSNMAEYLSSEALTDLGFPKISPLTIYSKKSDGVVVPDYFLKVGSLYLGEMLADHDFCEDDWEDLYAVRVGGGSERLYASRFLSDLWADYDNDGWCNWEECRAGTDPTRESSVSYVQSTVAEHPVPSVSLTVRYNGSTTVGGQMVVRAYQLHSEEGQPDARWAMDIGSGSSSAESDEESDSKVSSKVETVGTAYQRIVGMNPGGKVTYSLGNGTIVPGTIEVSFLHLRAYSTYYGRYLNMGEALWATGLQDYNVRKETTADLYATMGSDGKPSLVVGSVDYAAGTVTIDFDKMPTYLYQMWMPQSGAGNATHTDSCSEPHWSSPLDNVHDYDRLSIADSYVRIAWNGQVAVSDHTWAFTVANADKGYLRSGKNTFEVFLDLNADGKWTAGEPYGVVTDVDVGWSAADVAVELNDTAPQMFRIDLASAAASNDFDSQKSLNDRGVKSSIAIGSNREVFEDYVGTAMPDAIETETRVRLVRTALNDRASYQTSSKTVYADAISLDVTKDLVANPLLSERDLLQTGALDLDWGTLPSIASSMGVSYANLTSVVYRVVLGDGPAFLSNSTNQNNLATAFVNTYEAGVNGAQTKCVPVNVEATVKAARPTFAWTHTNTIGKDYPAFRLRVWDEKGTTLVYDSGNLKAPPRDATGVYTWSPPIYADMATPQGVVFATSNNYQWAVSMLDAKFTAPNTSETRTAFRLECSGAGGGLSDYGAFDVAVRYYGPGKTSFTASNLKGLVRVQAFTSPDFAGDPVAEGFLRDGTALVDNTDIETVNCLLRGLPADTYYVRAYIDSNGNGAFDRWESWGYANAVGLDTTTPYTPKAVTIERGSTKRPYLTVFIEDMDSDGDGFPDVWEYDQYKNEALTSRGPASGPTFFTQINPNLKSTLSGLTTLANAGLASAPLTSMLSITDAGEATAATFAAANLLAGAPTAAAEESVTVSIASFSLTDGIMIETATDVPATASSFVQVKEQATVTVSLVAADTLDFADAVEAVVKTITIRANATEKTVITADELKAVLDANNLSSKAFFKVKLTSAK